MKTVIKKRRVFLQPLEEKHLPQSARLFTQVFNAPPWNEEWTVDEALARLTGLFNTPGFVGMVALRHPDIVGFAMGYVEHWQNQKHFYLREMCVRSQNQGQGIGTTMVLEFETQLARTGVTHMYALAARSTTVELFYQKCGFSIHPKLAVMGKDIIVEDPDTG